MFYRKLVAILLLGFYGIPAALGPHWHHHRCTEVACVSEHSSAHSQLTRADAANHHCSCPHHAPLKAQRGHAHKPTAWTDSIGQADGPCAVCAFYASAQCPAVTLAWLDQHAVLSVLTPLAPEEPSILSAVAHARGPPAVVA